MKKKSKTVWLVVLFSAFVCFSLSAETQGLHANRIVFGQSACTTGPNAQVGLSYSKGIEVAFQEFNDGGGLSGKKLELIVLDDGYEPDHAAANADRFVEKDDVLAVIGGVGTPTAMRIAPILRSANIPFIGHVTGADFLFDAARYPNVTNLRASYLDEVRTLVDHIVDELEEERIGIIYQDDAFGRAILRDLQQSLEGHDLPLLAKSRFSRNTHAVHASLFEIGKADLDAIFLVGTYPAVAAIINLADSLDEDYTMASLSFSLSYELRNRITQPHERLLHTEVMPSPIDEGSELAMKFRSALQVAGEDNYSFLNETALEGYLLGRFLISTLKQLGTDITRETFAQSLRSSSPVMIEDWVIEFEPDSNKGSEYVRLTTLVPLMKTQLQNQ